MLSLKVDSYEEHVDVEPLIIKCGVEEWVHPYIDSWFTPDESNYDDSVFRMYFRDLTGAIVQVYFKSYYLNNKIANWAESGDLDSSDPSKWPDQDTLFCPPYIDSVGVSEVVVLTITEDFWCPGVCLDDHPEVKNSRDYARLQRNYPTEQFCFTKFGETISAFFENTVMMELFSLDCSLTTDGDDWWCDS